MAKIYISSTYSDLKDYREEVYRALRKLGHDVVAMEDYTASDQRPLDKCLEDVEGCDVYIGIFAWRYGYVPPNEEKSITELEFRTAAGRKICLIFLLDDNAPWSRVLMDKDEKIEKLREELKKEFMVEFFSNKDELAGDIGIAVSKVLSSGESVIISKLVGSKASSNGMQEILGMLKSIINFFIGIIVVDLLLMLSYIFPYLQSLLPAPIIGLSVLGSILVFAVTCLVFFIHKFISKFEQIAKEA